MIFKQYYLFNLTVSLSLILFKFNIIFIPDWTEQFSSGSSWIYPSGSILSSFLISILLLCFISILLRGSNLLNLLSSSIYLKPTISDSSCSTLTYPIWILPVSESYFRVPARACTWFTVWSSSESGTCTSGSFYSPARSS